MSWHCDPTGWELTEAELSGIRIAVALEPHAAFSPPNCPRPGRTGHGTEGNRAYSGPTREWHLELTNSVEHAAFDLRPRSRQAVEPPGPPLGHAGLEAVGPVGDAVHRDGPEQLPVQRRPVARAPVGLVVDQRPERLEDLE